MTPTARAAAWLAAAATLLVVGAMARGATGRWLTGDGVGAAQRPLRAGPPAPPPPRARLRVVVLDGLATADAHGPALDALCARGAELDVDVGFPTKSLPVQAVLWTGLTAQQLGLGPSNRARTLPPGALPAAVPDALAVVEAWTVIARSVGFAAVEPDARADWAAPDADPAAVAAWRGRFAAAARAAVASDRGLVLVHVLAIDRAGHAGGRDAAYRAAVADADRLLATLVAARPDAAWVVLGDHGHLAGGGHGDAEPAVRRVRGCVAPRPPAAPPRGPVHLVDVARHLRDVSGVAPRPGATGRRLASAMRAADPDATLPRLGAVAPAVAGLVLLAALIVAARRARPRWTVAWLPIAVAVDLAWRGVPTLSSRDRTAALACAVAAAAPALWLARRDRRALGAMATLAAGAIAATAIAARVPGALAAGTPPARPYVTAILDVAVSALAPVLGLAWLAWLATRAWPGAGGGPRLSATPDSRAARSRGRPTRPPPRPPARHPRPRPGSGHPPHRSDQ